LADRGGTRAQNMREHPATRSGSGDGHPAGGCGHDPPGLLALFRGKVMSTTDLIGWWLVLAWSLDLAHRPIGARDGARMGARPGGLWLDTKDVQGR
jgi:hypothetical protein